jgi:hypothetical protein
MIEIIDNLHYRKIIVQMEIIQIVIMIEIVELLKKMKIIHMVQLEMNEIIQNETIEII